MRRRLGLALTGMLGLTGLTGCFSSMHKVTRVQVGGTYKTATPEELESEISQRYAAVKTLSAAVLITASTGGANEGKIKTYTSFRGYIFVQKPRDLRVILQLPVIGSKAMDMVSDGAAFKLVIPPRNQAIEGTSEVATPSKNGLENLRPAVFFDSLLVAGVGPDEFAAMTQSVRVIEPAHGRKPEMDEPDYDLAVYTTSSDHLLRQERVIHISRATMLPYEQDIFDAQGRLVTKATYENYAPAGDIPFPRLVTITRPLDEYSLTIQVNKLMLNATLPSDQFELRIPAGMKIRQLP